MSILKICYLVVLTRVLTKRKSLENSRLLKCRWPDSNRHGFPLDFESSASANSATSARVWCNEDILALKHHFVNGFPRFGVLQSERKFIGRVNTDWPADGDACQFSVFHGCLDGNGTARFLEDEGKRFLMTQA